MAWFRQSPGLTTPTGSPAWQADLPIASARGKPRPVLWQAPAEERFAALCAFASGTTALLALAVDWRLVRPFPVAFYFLAYSYWYIVPFFWAGTIGLGFGSRSRVLRTLSALPAAFAALSYVWTRFAGEQLPFTATRFSYGVAMLLGVVLWWRRQD